MQSFSDMDSMKDAPFPWKYVIAFFVCVVLTGLAILVALGLHLPQAVTVFIVLAMAFIQVILQLTLLLHSTFQDERWMRLAVLLGASGIAAIVVGFTVLVMTFQMGVS